MRNQINLGANMLIRCAPVILANGEKKNGPGSPTKERNIASSKDANRRRDPDGLLSVERKVTMLRQCKSKKKLPAKLLQIIQQDDFDDESYTWSASPLGAVYSLETNTLSDSEDDETTTGDDNSSNQEDSVLVVKNPYRLI